jgi:DNA-binding LacI/PurR family transcriptional regulator
MQRVTIKTVAEAAGVTHTTVSRVIHDDSRISEKTADRVRAAMTRLDYRPNLIARGLVQNHTQVIALINPEVSPFAVPIIRSIAECCHDRQYAMMLFPTNTWLMEQLSFQWITQHWLVDGVIIHNLIQHAHVPQPILDLRAAKYPFVFINKFLDEADLNAVGVDDNDALDRVVRYLVELGHRRIGLLNGDLTSTDGYGRDRGFHRAMKNAGLPNPESRAACAMWRDTDAREATLRMLDQPDPPTAFFCANDMMGIGALRACRERGLRVPQDISIVGYDDHEVAHHIETPLTTIRPPLAEVGKKSFDLMMRIIQERTRPPEQIRVPAQLVIRASTGPASAK